jgi:hypothetical protein
MLEKRIRFFAEQILILFWMVSGGGVYFVLARIPATAALFFYTLVLIFVFKPKIKNLLINASIYTIAFILFCMFVCYLFAVQPQDLNNYAFIVVLFILSGFICLYLFSAFTYPQFLKLFYNGLNIIRIHAICAAIMMPLLMRYSFIVTNVFSGFEAWTFKYLFFQKTDQYAFGLFGLAIFRNQGLFWEPGVLQFYLILLLFIQLYILKSKNGNIFITVFTILTTYSTTAFACMLLVLSVYLFGLMKKKIFAGIFAMIAVAGGFIPLFISNLQNKFEGEKVTSSRVRLYDFLEQFLVIKDYFLTGVGMDSGEYARVRTHYPLTGDLAYLSFNGEEVGSTNSLMLLLGTMGIIMGGLWLLAYIGQQFVPVKLVSRKEKMVLIIFLLIGISVEPLLLHTFFVTFMFSGMLFTFIKLKYPGLKSLWKSEF